MKEKFFLGANSYKGFVSYFEQLQKREDGLQLLILKGGPGSGKSSLMKRVAAFGEKEGHHIEYIPCASDPSSLDAFIDHSAHFAMADGTSPHVMDPSLPGAQQHIMYTGDGWDCDKLTANRGEIDRINSSVSLRHSGAAAYIRAAASLLSENLRFAYKFINKNELYAFAQEIVSFLTPGTSCESKRLLSAVSVGRIVFFEETLSKLCDKVYVIEDKWGAAANYLLQAVKEGLLAVGTPFISCNCSVIPEKLEHIIIPSEGIALSTANSFHSAHSEANAVISGVYGEIENIELLEKRLYSAQTLFCEACECVKEAKEIHDKLEACYVGAMNFTVNDEKYFEIIKRFYR